MRTSADVSVSNLAILYSGQCALTMLFQLPAFSGSPVVRFDRWIKQFESVVAMSDWDDDETILMLTTKMTDKANDILQNILECHTRDYDTFRRILHNRFHGSATEDFYQRQFQNFTRRLHESIIDFGYRLNSIFQRAYPPQPKSSSTNDIAFQFLRQKFLQGLGADLRYKIQNKNGITNFQDLVAETQKYSIRLDAVSDERSKEEFVNACQYVQTTNFQSGL